MKKIIQNSIAVGGLVGFALLASSAFAQTVSVGANLDLGTSTGGTNVGTTGSAQVETAVQMRGDTELDNRVSDLTALSARVGTMVHLSTAESAAIAANIQTEIGNLTNLKGKIDAETGATLKADVNSITTSFRIYMLVVPQVRILAAADRAETITEMFTALSAKFQTRITAAQAAGDNVTSLQATLTDFNAKTVDASTQAQAAITLTANLVPDQGNKTTMESNDAALVSARADIKTAGTDLQAAYQDAKAIVAGIEALDLNASSAATTTAATAGQ